MSGKIGLRLLGINDTGNVGLLINLGTEKTEFIGIKELIVAVRDNVVNVVNVEIRNGELKNSEGSDDRIFRYRFNEYGNLEVFGEYKISILKELVQNGKKVGYRVVTNSLDVINIRNTTAISLAREVGIANAKLVKRDGKEYIASIKGKFGVTVLENKYNDVSIDELRRYITEKDVPGLIKMDKRGDIDKLYTRGVRIDYFEYELRNIYAMLGDRVMGQTSIKLANLVDKKSRNYVYRNEEVFIGFLRDNDIETAKKIIDYGYDINAKEEESRVKFNLIDYVIQHSKDFKLDDKQVVDVVRNLIGLGCKLSGCMMEGGYSLAQAVSRNKKELAKLLIDNGVEINSLGERKLSFFLDSGNSKWDKNRLELLQDLGVYTENECVGDLKKLITGRDTEGIKKYIGGVLYRVMKLKNYKIKDKGNDITEILDVYISNSEYHRFRKLLDVVDSQWFSEPNIYVIELVNGLIMDNAIEYLELMIRYGFNFGYILGGGKSLVDNFIEKWVGKLLYDEELIEKLRVFIDNGCNLRMGKESGMYAISLCRNKSFHETARYLERLVEN